MGYMKFKDETLEKIFKTFKWTRNNTVQIFEEALKNNILDYRSTSQKATAHTFQPLIFQFRCILTTTNKYYRDLTNHENKNYGVLIRGKEVLSKGDIEPENVKEYLEEQLEKLEEVLKNFDSANTQTHIDSVVTLGNHEYLHQGQMVVAFREAGVELPERFVKAWAL